MATTLAEIRAKIQAASQAGNTNNKIGDNAIFPHWNIKENQPTTLRFLPDADSQNPWGFWVERAVIKLPFTGIVGEASSRPTLVQVPCMEMYGPKETCPILTEARSWFKTKDPEDEARGRTYWKKKSYLFQGFVVDTTLQEDKTPDNPIRRFVMTAQIVNIIKSGLIDPEIESLPTDYVHGLDFKVVKTLKGKYADYSTSSYARRERALNDTELKAISEYGLYDLKSFLPKKPTEVELKVIMEMFEASVNGDAFDGERWGQYYKPSNYSANNAGNKSTDDSDVVEEVATPVTTAHAAPAPSVETPSTGASSRANDILKKIRSRTAQ